MIYASSQDQGSQCAPETAPAAQACRPRGHPYRLDRRSLCQEWRGMPQNRRSRIVRCIERLSALSSTLAFPWIAGTSCSPAGPRPRSTLPGFVRISRGNQRFCGSLSCRWFNTYGVTGCLLHRAIDPRDNVGQCLPAAKAIWSAGRRGGHDFCERSNRHAGANHIEHSSPRGQATTDARSATASSGRLFCLGRRPQQELPAGKSRLCRMHSRGCRASCAATRDTRAKQKILGSLRYQLLVRAARLRSWMTWIICRGSTPKSLWWNQRISTTSRVTGGASRLSSPVCFRPFSSKSPAQTKTERLPPYPAGSEITFQSNYSCPEGRGCTFSCPGRGGASHVTKLTIYLGRMPIGSTNALALFYEFSTVEIGDRESDMEAAKRAGLSAFRYCGGDLCAFTDVVLMQAGGGRSRLRRQNG